MQKHFGLRPRCSHFASCFLKLFLQSSDIFNLALTRGCHWRLFIGRAGEGLPGGPVLSELDEGRFHEQPHEHGGGERGRGRTEQHQQLKQTRTLPGVNFSRIKNLWKQQAATYVSNPYIMFHH